MKYLYYIIEKIIYYSYSGMIWDFYHMRTKGIGYDANEEKSGGIKSTV